MELFTKLVSAELVIESYNTIDSVTTCAFRIEQKFFRCKPLRAIQHVLAVSSNNYIKRHN